MKQLFRFSVLVCVLFIAYSCDKTPSDDVSDVVYDPTPYDLLIPETFPILEIPADNPTTVEGIRLGRRLYYDSLLHKNQEHSCSTCHIQSKAFSSFGEVLPHINLAWNQSYLWKGDKTMSLEEVMIFEVEEFFEANLEVLQEDEVYPDMFFEAFGTKEISYKLAGYALAQFEKTMMSGNSRYDQATTLGSGVFFNDEEFNGMQLFFTEEGDCFHCHGGILFTDGLFHNNGLDANLPNGAGREFVTGNSLDRGRYKTPTLRNIELTGPYMHDGRYETLEEVIDFYSEGLHFSETIDPLMKNVHQGGVRLTEVEKAELLAFLKTLTDTSFINNPSLSDPFQ